MQALGTTMKTVAQYIHDASQINNPGLALKHPGLSFPTDCPVKKCDTVSTLRYVIQHLNDKHKWKREAIADWLDTLPQQPVFYPQIEEEEENDGYLEVDPPW